MSTQTTTGTSASDSGSSASDPTEKAAVKAPARKLPTAKLVVGALVVVGGWTLLTGPATALKHTIESAYAPTVTMTKVNVATPGAAKK